MKIRPRTLEVVLSRSLAEFPVTTLVGLRYAGKTTLAGRSAPDRAYVTFDDLGALDAARRDPEGFLKGLSRPVTIDEAQRVPELLLPIKREVDRNPRPGQFLLTGSARIELRRGVAETLAGRAAILRLRPMTWAEAAGKASWNPLDLLFGCRSVSEASGRFAAGSGTPLEGARVLAGGLPFPLLRRRGEARARWFEQYRATYMEKDVPPLVHLEEVSAFVRFLSLAAARTAQTTNFAALAHESGISADTGLRWLGVLEATYLADLVPPWWRNIGKRLVKSPKLHFGDAGLAGHLLGIRRWEDAVRGNLGGALLETLVAQHLLVFADCSKRSSTSIFHYRTHAGAEVDFVAVRGSRLLPIEVKATSSVRGSDLGGLRSFLDDFGAEAPFGVCLTGGTEVQPAGHGILAIPLVKFLEGLP